MNNAKLKKYMYNSIVTLYFADNFLTKNPRDLKVVLYKYQS